MPRPMSAREAEAIAKAEQLFKACEVTGAVGASHFRNRQLVAAGGHRLQIPAAAIAETVSFVQANLASVFGACYLEADGEPVLGAGTRPERQHTSQNGTGEVTGAPSLSALLAARRQALRG